MQEGGRGEQGTVSVKMTIIDAPIWRAHAKWRSSQNPSAATATMIKSHGIVS